MLALLPGNCSHAEHAQEMIFARPGKSVAVVGLSFKSGTDDLRESPIVTLVEQLIGKGFDLRIYDPEVQVSRLTGVTSMKPFRISLTACAKQWRRRLPVQRLRTLRRQSAVVST